MADAALAQRIAAVRRFNRFYTQRIGVLRQEGWGDSPFSLTEARVLYEILHRDKPTASEIGGDLGLDAGYLSRILRGFASRGLVAKERSQADARQILLTLTPAGRKAFAPLEAFSDAEVGKMLGALPPADQGRLVEAMQDVAQILAGSTEGAKSYLLRAHQPGDMGWIVSRHGVLYAQERGWGPAFEALVADIVAAFLRNFDPACEHCWIAERNGENVGSVMLVKEAQHVARLRLLLVEPNARGLGIGRRLVEECIRFARSAGYRQVTLWTQSILTEAREVYRRTGFTLTHKERHAEFGKKLTGETWDLAL
jgi:DNA-binding MarR family transcriptional regulator/GNAT superfamily N-acetyltransferase